VLDSSIHNPNSTSVSLRKRNEIPLLRSSAVPAEEYMMPVMGGLCPSLIRAGPSKRPNYANDDNHDSDDRRRAYQRVEPESERLFGELVASTRKPVDSATKNFEG